MMIRHPLVRKTLALATATAFVCACYVQRPVTSAAPAPTSRIVAFVTDTGSVVMSNAIGPGATEIEGVMVDSDGDHWRLQMLRVDQRGGFSTRWNREVVTFPRFALTNVTQKVLDKKRSWAFAGLAAIVVLGSTLFFGEVIGGDNSDPPTPPPF
jgi:hypothetical protein